MPRKTKTTAEYQLQAAGDLMTIDALKQDLEAAAAARRADQAAHAREIANLQTQLGDRAKVIDSLKADLFQAHQTIATQRGYIARALEDDAVRELGAVQDQPAMPAQKISRRCAPCSVDHVGGAYRQADSWSSSRDQVKPWFIR